jgi:hypothetical protein
MKRFAISITVLALSVALLAPLQASAKSGPSTSAVTSVNLTAVATPNTVFGSPVVSMVSTPVALPGDITFARFWIDMANHQVNHPSASYTCAQAGSSASCQYMGTSYGPTVYSSNYPYSGGSGVHAATVQLWRDTASDPAPVFVGQASTSVLIP